ncbi:ATP-binding protein [Planomonospora sp. ID91781]|uniref:ATP-binding protein n=1 Tax=Planomonospora sp. ID91781 TaxID=2738135 RepID=UPI0018C3854D|nr:ATP-binding protein [Planomonospora sp. ID91781]MBG0824904.1 ATP-binding protein [Planomonospora sp. ID91781]
MDDHDSADADTFPEPRPALITRSRLWRGFGPLLWRRPFPGRGDQAALARRLVRLLLDDTDRADDAEWITAEFVSNALLHTRSGQPGGHFVVEVQRGMRSARITVYDLGGNGVPVFDRGQRDGGLRESGRGLCGVAELADKTGAHGDPVVGHAVWARLALRPQDAPRSA